MCEPAGGEPGRERCATEAAHARGGRARDRRGGRGVPARTAVPGADGGRPDAADGVVTAVVLRLLQGPARAGAAVDRADRWRAVRHVRALVRGLWGRADA